MLTRRHPAGSSQGGRYAPAQRAQDTDTNAGSLKLKAPPETAPKEYHCGLSFLVQGTAAPGSNSFLSERARTAAGLVGKAVNEPQHDIEGRLVGYAQLLSRENRRQGINVLVTPESPSCVMCCLAEQGWTLHDTLNPRQWQLSHENLPPGLQNALLCVRSEQMGYQWVELRDGTVIVNAELWSKHESRDAVLPIEYGAVPPEGGGSTYFDMWAMANGTEQEDPRPVGYRSVGSKKADTLTQL